MQNRREIRSGNSETKDPQLKTKLSELMLKLLTHKLPTRMRNNVSGNHARARPADCATRIKPRFRGGDEEIMEIGGN